MKGMYRIAASLAILFGLFGCQGFGTGASQAPGSFSFYNEVMFQNAQDLCGSADQTCLNQVATYFGSGLTTAGWHANHQVTDTGVSPTQASTIIGDGSNVVYMSSHGGGQNGTTNLCLYACNGFAYGGDVAVSTAGIPDAWGGPNWLILDACQAVNQNMGWESKFGGNLHGILGFNQSVDTIGDGTSALGSSGLETLVNDMNAYQPAIKSWEDAVAAADDTPAIGMLVPQTNAADVMEASSGGNFGRNGDTSPQFYQGQPDGSISVIQPAGVAVNDTTYSLTPQAVNESQWISAYGSPSGTWTYPNANEHKFTTSTAMVRHYLASGGIVAETPASGTAGGVSQTQALQYAQTWIANNGGLPSDAVLSYAGHVTNPNLSVIVTQRSISAIPTTSYPAYDNTREWVFIWRHASNGILLGDKIEAIVDDAGTWTADQTPCHAGAPQICLRPPWNPSPRVRFYSRVWRSLAAPSRVTTMSLPRALSSDSSASATMTGYCAPDMASTSTTATPCQQYTSSTNQLRYFFSLVTGVPLGAR
jgi:hypothetical protein